MLLQHFEENSPRASLTNTTLITIGNILENFLTRKKTSDAVKYRLIKILLSVNIILQVLGKTLLYQSWA